MGLITLTACPDRVQAPCGWGAHIRGHPRNTRAHQHDVPLQWVPRQESHWSGRGPTHFIALREV